LFQALSQSTVSASSSMSLLAIAGTIHTQTKECHVIHDRKSIYANMECPLLKVERDDDYPMPAMPIHCVMECVEKKGFEATRRLILRACDLTKFIHRSDVLSAGMFNIVASKINRKIARMTRSQISKLMAQPFPFIDFKVPGETDLVHERRAWRMRKNSTGSSSDSESSSESLDNLTIKDFVAEDLPTSFNGFESASESELDLSDEEDEEDDEESVMGDIIEYGEDVREIVREETEDDGSDLSEGEIDYESDVDEDEIIVVD
ncbi:hypothetical protein PFISCL1PPCAC_10718, partial [Pristionchus fissidentatus]